MEYQQTLPAAEEIVCEHCQFNQPNGNKFCSACSFPMQGTDLEKQNFRLIVSSRKRLLKDSEEKIKSAKIMIYTAAGLFFLSGMLVYFSQNDIGILIVNLLICLTYLILAAWSSKNPFGAILTAFIVYVTVLMVNLFIDPSSIFSGIILKIVIIAAFVKGIRSAREAQGYLKELQKLKAAPVFE